MLVDAHSKCRSPMPWREAWLFVAMASCLGCGSVYDSQVSGVVILDGIPLERGIVAFYPKQKGPVAHGIIQADGSYTVFTGREEGMPSGDYDVTIVSTEAAEPNSNGTGPPPPGRRLTSEHLSDRKTTDLHYTIEPGNNKIEIQIESQS